MYRLKQFIENLNDKVISKDIYVHNKTVFVGDYQYKDGNWYIKVENNYICLQGGIPNYTTDTNLDEDLFEAVG